MQCPSCLGYDKQYPYTDPTVAHLCVCGWFQRDFTQDNYVRLRVQNIEQGSFNHASTPSEQSTRMLPNITQFTQFHQRPPGDCEAWVVNGYCSRWERG
jgi:hypothetical protein